LEALAKIAGTRELGNLTLAAEDARSVWRWTWLDGILADRRHALRVLRAKIQQMPLVAANDPPASRL